MRRELAAVALVVAGCGPTVLWSGRTPDRAHGIQVIDKGGLQYVIVDGVQRAAFRGIAASSLALRDDHVAFAARVGEQWTVVLDGRRGESWNHVGEVQLGPHGHLAYIAERAGGWYVTVDGVTGPRFDAIRAGSLQLDDSGQHVAYVGEAAKQVRAVVDGVGEPAYDGVGAFRFTAGGARHAYVARHGDDAVAVVDGVPGPAWSAIAKLALAGDHRFAYAAEGGDNWRVVVDGEPGPAVDAVYQLAFSDDGTHVAYASRVASVDAIVIDGAPVDSFPHGVTPALAIRAEELAYTQSVASGGARIVVVGGDSRVLGPVFAEVRAPLWVSASVVAYAARRGRAWIVVAGDREMPGGDHVFDPIAAPSGPAIAYVARRGHASYVVAGGVEQRFDFVFDDTLTLAADGHWAIVAGDLAREELFIAIDQAPRVPLRVVDLYTAASTSPRADTLRAWAAAELARVSRGGR